MSLYLVICERYAESKEYQGFKGELRKLKAVKVLRESWLVRQNTGRAQELTALLHQHLVLPNDRLLIQEVTRDSVGKDLLISDGRLRGLLKSARG
jgi:hypothetical protein